MKIVYETFDEFKTSFLKSSSVKQPRTIFIQETEYSLHYNEQATIHAVINNKPLVAMYKPVSGSGIGIAWVFENDHFVPKDVELLPFFDIIEENDNVVGSTAEVTFTRFSNAHPIRAKVDTGADVCSLHCPKWKISGDNVSFVAPDVSQNVISMALHDRQAVKTADGGVEYRPVVELDIAINGHEMSKIAFNLNDRSGMDFPILIGQNALQKGKFLVNPSVAAESFSWEQIETYFRSKE